MVHPVADLILGSLPYYVTPPIHACGKSEVKSLFTSRVLFSQLINPGTLVTSLYV